MSAPPNSVATGAGTWLWANPVGNVSKTNSIGASNEVDQYRFAADQTGSYTITVTSTSLDSQLRIYDSNGLDISGIVDRRAAGGTETYTLSYSTATWFYVVVTGFQTGTGSYTINIKGPSPAPQPRISTPPPTYSGQTSDGALDYGGDLDYYTVSAPGGTSRLNLTVTPAAGINTYVELYNASGVLLQTIANGAAGSADSASNIPVTSGGTYYVGVSGVQSAATGSYTVRADFGPDTVLPPTLSIAAVSANKAEGNGGGATPFTFTVTRSGDTSGSASVSWSVGANQSPAVNAADFFSGTLPAGTLNWNAGDSASKTITVNVRADSIFESAGLAENFTVTLTNPSGAAIGTAIANGSIQNDDANTGASVLSIAALSASKDEGNGGGTTPFTFTVSRSGSTNGSASVTWSVGANQSPDANAEDFLNNVFPTGTLVWNAGDVTSKTITVNVKADSAYESAGLVERFTVSLANAGGAIIDNASANGAILNDDTEDEAIGSNITVFDTWHSSFSDSYAWPRIASLPQGRFAIGSLPIGAQVFTESGAQVGSKIPLSEASISANLTAGFAKFLGGINLANGGFATTAEASSGGSNNPFDVRVQLYSAGGQAIGQGLLANSTTIGVQRFPEITSLAGGGFVVSWEDWGATGIHSGYARGTMQVFDAAGRKIGGEQILGYYGAPSMAGLSNGNFATVYKDVTQNLIVQVFNSTGVRIGSEVLFGPDNANILDSRIASLTDGRFVVVRTDYSSSTANIIAQVFDSHGIRLGTELVASATRPVGVDGRPWDGLYDVAGLPNGNFVVVWEDIYGFSSTDKALTARIFETSPGSSNEGDIEYGGFDFPLGVADSSGRRNVPTPQASDSDGFRLGNGTSALSAGWSSDGGFGAYEPHARIIADAAIRSEGNAGKTTYTFKVTLGRDALSTRQTVDWTVAGAESQSATASDFIGGAFPRGTVTFEAGDTLETITIDVAGDTSLEPDETFVVELSNPSSRISILAQGKATGVIQDDDGASPSAKTSTDTFTYRDYHLGADWNSDATADDDDLEVYAAAEGQVWFARAGGDGWQNVVIIKTMLPGNEHGGFVMTMYAHLGELSVALNDVVQRGQKIGRLGDYGDPGPFGDHLHLEIRTGDNPISNYEPGDSRQIERGYTDRSPPQAGWLDPTDFIKNHRDSATGVPGTVSDGYLVGATVFADANENGELDEGEVWTTSDESGSFSLVGAIGPLVAFGGVDITTGLPFEGRLAAPAGSWVVTPMSTLIKALQIASVMASGSAEEAVRSSLGLEPDVSLLEEDSIAETLAGDSGHGAAYVASVRIYGTAHLISSALAGETGNPTRIIGHVFEAMAAAIRNVPEGQIYDLADPATVAGLVSAAGQAEGLDIGPIVDNLVALVIGSNSLLADGLQAHGSGSELVSQTSAVQRVAQGEIAGALRAADLNPAALAQLVSDYSGAGLLDAVSAADDELAPRLVSIATSAEGAQEVEGDTGVSSFRFVVTLDRAAAVAQTVSWLVDGDESSPATAGDFVGGALPWGTLTFLPGQTAQEVTVSVQGDSSHEADEGFSVGLFDPSLGLALNTTSASGRILNDDPAAASTHRDAFVVAQDEVLATGAAATLLVNDSSATTAALKAGPAHGSLLLATDGSFSYTPTAGFHGIDSFTYQAGNGGTTMATATATLYVVPVAVGATTTLDLLALTAEEQIAATYVAFFGRAADADGFGFWVGEFNRGLPVQGPAKLFANIASSFGISDEAKALYSFLVNPFTANDGQISTFLESVYQNLFNRGSDAAGLGYWTGQIKQTLHAGQFVGSVLVNIMSGAQDTVAGKDITTLMGKLAVSLEFVREQEQHDTVWAGASDITAATSLLQPVTSDPLSVLVGVRNAEALIAAHP